MNLLLTSNAHLHFIYDERIQSVSVQTEQNSAVLGKTNLNGSDRPLHSESCVIDYNV